MNITDYIQPELLVLIPVLVLIGAGIKKSPIRDELIPIILGAVAVTLSLVWVLATCELPDGQAVLMAIFTGLTQGVLVAGASVYTHQIHKQLTELNGGQKGN